MSSNSTNVGQIDLSLILNSGKFDSQLKNIDNIAGKTSDRISASLSKIGKAALAAFSVKAIVGFGKECLKVATETSNAWIGLNSILTGQGKSFDKAKQFINDYISDGLVPLNNAVAAYKNLTLRGYSSDQIEKTMNALKNSATFARQSTYSLGDAIQTATEGLKNENSVVVDNAGVTKNVAKMWEDYAKSIGKTTNNLTQAEKIQAEVNGIIEETKFQSNDAAIYTRTYSGVMAKLSTAFTTLKTAVGNVIQPLAKLFVPIITTAVNAVTKLFTALSGLLALFGLKADSVETVSGGMGDLATQAGDASDAISGIGDSAKKAGKEAKKASNNLAAFDNLQVLQKDTGASSGDSAGTGGSSISTSGNIESTKEITSMVDKAAEKLKNLFGNINFEPLINSFNNLKAAIQPIIDNISKGLKWFLDNVLVPLAKWTIQDLIPAFFNLLAGALKVLNPLLEASKPIFEWLWNSFLQPIAKWTGGIIVSVLNQLSNALSKIGKWMSENKPIVTNMEIAVLGFFGAWKTIELMSFIAQSGGVIKALTLITSAITKGVIAKIADKAETIALTLMYAKDFVMSIISGTAALVKQAAQWVINTALKVAETAATVAYNVATTAATAATWLFNTALAVLTSPITLVIAAIAGLVAGIILLIKNWDKVKQVASMCWEFIKSVWNNASEWFNNRIVIPIKNLFNNLWNNVKNIASNAWNGLKGIFSNVGTWFSNKFQEAYNGITRIFKNIGSFFSGIWNNIKNTFSKLGTSIGNAISNSVKSGINGVLSLIEKTINKAIGLINGAIGVINLIPGVNISKLAKLNIPRLAEGGYVKANTPQLAMIGDNRHQGEVVAPEDKMLDMILTALKMFQEQNNNNSNNTNNNNREIVIKFAGSLAQLIRVLKPELDRESKRQGDRLIIGGTS